MENPQVEVSEVVNPDLEAQTMAEQIVNTLERFGPKRFKATGYRALQRIMDAGAMGAEIVISGRGVPSKRSKTWRFSAGYLKKSGDISENFVKKGYAVSHLKSGAVGVKVIILTPDIKLPDKIRIKVEEQEPKIIIEEIKEEPKEEIEKKPKKSGEVKNGDNKKKRTKTDAKSATKGKIKRSKKGTGKG